MQITSLLDLRYAAELEELLFSHPHQGRLRCNIIESVAQYGSPKVVLRNGGLRIDLPTLADVQALYAIIDAALVGALVYTRTANDALEILHIVVREDYTYHEAEAQHGVALELVDAVCYAGHRIRGIRSIRLAYNHGQVFLKPVSPCGKCRES